MDTLEDKKGENIMLMDLRKVVSFTDYFIICTATSSRMLNALADEVLEKVRTKFKKKGRRIGTPDAGWMIVDYGDIVVHLMDPEIRKFYSLEDLWGQGKILLRLQ